MEVLGMRLQTMGYGKQSLGAAAGSDTQDKSANIRRLVAQIKLHQAMLVSTKKFEGYFSIAFFTQIAFSGMVICSLTNELANVSTPPTFLFIQTFWRINKYSILIEITNRWIRWICRLHHAVDGTDDTDISTLLFRQRFDYQKRWATHAFVFIELAGIDAWQ